MEKPDALNLLNICSGAAQQVFERAIGEVMDNIKDPSTPADTKRKITLEFDFAPYPDRGGSTVAVTCKTKLSGVEPTAGSVFFSAMGGEWKAYPRDPRQEHLFDAPASDKKQ